MARTPETYDVAIVGGGASGLAAALSAARAGARAVVIERDVEAGLSILATGNGRCNLSNASLDPARYRHPEIARDVMGPAPERELAGFFDSVGIFTCRIDDRLYPYSRRAESVRDALLSACAREGVALCCCCDVTDAARADGAWRIGVSEPDRAPRGKRHADFKASLRARRRELAAAPRVPAALRARRAVIACGGASGAVAALFGLPHLDEAPVLCPIACSPAGDGGALAALDGLRADARLTLSRDGAPVWSEPGEVLFRPYGISGIAAFDLSRRAEPGDTVALDLFPAYSVDELEDAFRARSGALGSPQRAGAAWFDGLLAPALGRLVAARVRDSREAGLARACKDLRLEVSGTADERSAQVRRGGIPFSAIELPDLRVRPEIAPALSACGEALDMDADCGGFNLAWAWLSGLRAGAAPA